MEGDLITRYFHGNGYNVGSALVHIAGDQAYTGELLSRQLIIDADCVLLDAAQVEEFGRRVQEIAAEFRSYEEGAR